jgi:hypothetical protein
MIDYKIPHVRAIYQTGDSEPHHGRGRPTSQLSLAVKRARFLALLPYATSADRTAPAVPPGRRRSVAMNEN